MAKAITRIMRSLNFSPNSAKCTESYSKPKMAAKVKTLKSPKNNLRTGTKRGKKLKNRRWNKWTTISLKIMRMHRKGCLKYTTKKEIK